ncbi:MAG: hypothetical protein IKV85_06750 [Ruminococcus sp.]|nr:hypothetical protein [Ruminococcus sp.]
MLKKFIALMLVCMVCITAFTACSNKKEVSGDTADGYVPQKDMEITIWNTAGTDYAAKSLNKNIVEDWLVEKSRVKVKNVYGNDGGQWDSKLSKLVAGNNLPEIVVCGSYQGPAHFSKLNALEKVWELTPELLQKYAPDVWKRVPQEYWDAIMVDGKILGIPFENQIMPQTQPEATEEELATICDLHDVVYNDISISGPQTLYIRDDILKMFYPEAKTYDELVAILEEKGTPIGDEILDVPIDSTEEYIDFMYDIKDLNLKENGKTIYPFGYFGSDNWCALAWLGADMYGYKNHYYTGTWNSITEKIEIPLAHDLIKEAARTQNKMLAEKVIDPESMACTTAQALEKITNGQYAIAPINGVGTLTEINDALKKKGKTYRYRPFYTQVPALKGYGAFKEQQLWNSSMCILKTATEEEMHQILNWINIQFTDEYESVRYWGPEEAGLYEVGEDGKRHFKDERFTKYFLEDDYSALSPEETLGLGGPVNAGYNMGGLFGINGTYYSKWEPKVHLNYTSYTPTVNSGFKFAADSVHTQNVALYPPCQGWSSVYTDIPEVVAFWAERDQWENDFKIAMAAPVDEFDEKWDKAVKDLNEIADIKAMEDKMTEIAKPIAESLKVQ